MSVSLHVIPCCNQVASGLWPKGPWTFPFTTAANCWWAPIPIAFFWPVHAEVGLELLLQARVDWPTVSQPHIINGLLRPPNHIILAQLQAAPVNKFVGQPKDVGESVIAYHLVPWSHGVSLCLLESLHRPVQLSSLLPSPQEEGALQTAVCWPP